MVLYVAKHPADTSHVRRLMVIFPHAAQLRLRSTTNVRFGARVGGDVLSGTKGISATVLEQASRDSKQD
jgi:uncharacterized protein YneR